MQKWEYEFVKIKHPRLPNTPTDLADFKLCLMDLGEEGWELVSVDNGVAYFKRLVEDLSLADARLRIEKMALESS
jgi:hypothetical protein